jgi:hypothetical protein
LFFALEWERHRRSEPAAQLYRVVVAWVVRIRVEEAVVLGGGSGGGTAIASVTHHAVWVPPPNVSAQNDGPFRPSTYQDV